MFQFTPVLRRATTCTSCGARLRGVSIHARLATGDSSLHYLPLGDVMFQFTPVLRRATLPPVVSGLCYGRFQFTPVLRRATERLQHGPLDKKVSIHARLATGDRDNFAIIAIKEPLQPFCARYDIINLP